VSKPTIHYIDGRVFTQIPAVLIPELVEWLMSDRGYAIPTKGTLYGDGQVSYPPLWMVFWEWVEKCGTRDDIATVLTAALKAFNERAPSKESP
jgi:hypothetical protein